MDVPPIPRPFGSPAIGATKEGSGYGSPVIGRGVQGLTPFGYLATGSKEGEDGSGIKGAGNIVDSNEFGVNNNNLNNFFSSELWTPNSWLEGLNMFGLGLPEILVILVIILLIFGAKRLPEIGAGLGKTMRELKGIRDDRKVEKEKKDTKGDVASSLKKELEDIPGLKEAKEIKKAADKLRNIRRFLK
jgi:sec-independent protein translocase protein TatA